MQYLKCSDTVTTNNQLVYVTSVFGSLSLLGALAIVAVIYAYRKDEESLRERILIGVFFGNAIYSAVNIVPIGSSTRTPAPAAIRSTVPPRLLSVACGSGASTPW